MAVNRSLFNSTPRSTARSLVPTTTSGRGMAAMQTKAASDAMAYDGVLADTLVLLVEA